MSKRNLIRYGKVVGLVALLTLFSLQTTGCFSKRTTKVNQYPVNGPTGTVQALAAVKSDALDGYLVKTSFIRDKTILTQESFVSDGKIQVTSPQLFIGEWQVQMLVLDAAEKPIYQGSTTVTVKANTTTEATITLRPADGILKVRMYLDDFAYIDGVIKGKLLTNEEPYVNFTVEDISKPVEVTLQLAPKHYDIAVVLYKDAYYNSNKFFTGEYQSVSIESGRTTFIEWRPSTGEVSIGVEIDKGPLPPKDVTFSLTRPGTITLTWTPSDGSVAAYNIYYRVDRQFMGYRLWKTVPATTTEIEVDLTQFSDAVELEMVITAVSASGVESHRSNSIYLPL